MPVTGLGTAGRARGLLLALLVAGCALPGPPELSPDRTVISQLPAEGRPPSGVSDQFLLAADSVWLGLADAPATEDALNRIAVRVFPAAPNYRIHVYLGISNAYYAFGEPTSGAMYVSTEAVYSARSEDEVAALLAHEMAHIALHHGAVDRLVGFGRELILPALVLLPFRQVVDKEQELQADDMAIDLLVRSGYCEDALSTVINRIGDNSNVRVQSPVYGMFTPPGATAGPSVKQQGLNTGYPEYQDRKKNLRTYSDRFYGDRAPCSSSPGFTAGLSGKTELGREHQALLDTNYATAALAAGRMDRAASGLAAADRTGYGDGTLTHFVDYTLAKRRGDLPGEVPALKAMMAKPKGVPVAFFLTIGYDEAARKDWTGAVAIIKAMTYDYPDRPSLLPYLVGYTRAADRADHNQFGWELNKAMLQCMTQAPYYLDGCTTKGIEP